jgi:hypothetical protein
MGVAKMLKKSSLRLPREHGAWAMLYVPFGVGVLAAWSGPVRLLLLFLSMTFVFIARESLLAWRRSRDHGREDFAARRFMIAYLLAAAFFGVPLLAVYKLYWLAPIAIATLILLAVNAQQAIRREDRTVGGELIAIAGLTLTAPAAYYVSTGASGSIALWMWALCALYFASSVFYVKLRVHTINPRKLEVRRQSWRRCAIYHSFLLAALLLLAATGSVNLFALAAFSPVLVRAFWRLANPVLQINLRRVGWFEIIYSFVFLVFATLTFRY